MMVTKLFKCKTSHFQCIGDLLAWMMEGKARFTIVDINFVVIFIIHVSVVLFLGKHSILCFANDA